MNAAAGADTDKNRTASAAAASASAPPAVVLVDSVLRWVGEPRDDRSGAGGNGSKSQSNQKHGKFAPALKHYSAYERGGHRYSIGTTVRVDSGGSDDTWLAVISGMWEDQHRQAWVQLVWFFTPEQTPLGGGTNSGSKAWRRQYHAREVFLSTHTDANLAEVILGPALILPGAAYHWVDAATRNSNSNDGAGGSGVSGSGVSGSGGLGAKTSAGGAKSTAAAAVISSTDISPADKLDVRRALQSASAAAAALAAATASKHTKSKKKQPPQPQSGKKETDVASSSDIVDNEVWRLVGCKSNQSTPKTNSEMFSNRRSLS